MQQRIKTLAIATAIAATLATCLAVACVVGHLAGCALPVAQAPAANASQSSNNTSTADQRVNVGGTKSLSPPATTRPYQPGD